jgi:hypothetical protein
MLTKTAPAIRTPASGPSLQFIHNRRMVISAALPLWFNRENCFASTGESSFMNTGKIIVGSTLVLSWGILLSARTIAAAIYATRVGHLYSTGLSNIGWLLPLAAWMCFAGGVAVFLRYGSFRKTEPHEKV